MAVDAWFALFATLWILRDRGYSRTSVRRSIDGTLDIAFDDLYSHILLLWLDSKTKELRLDIASVATIIMFVVLAVYFMALDLVGGHWAKDWPANDFTSDLVSHNFSTTRWFLFVHLLILTINEDVGFILLFVMNLFYKARILWIVCINLALDQEPSRFAGSTLIQIAFVDFHRRLVH